MINRRFLESAKSFIRRSPCFVFFFCNLGILGEGEQSFKDEKSPTRSWGGNRSASRTAVRAPLLATLPAESAAKECQCVRYHRPQERERVATRATPEGG